MAGAGAGSVAGVGAGGVGAGGVGGWRGWPAWLARQWGWPASLPMAMSSPSPIAAAANLLLTRHSRRCRCHYRHPRRRRAPPTSLADRSHPVFGGRGTSDRPIAAERAVHTSAGGTHDLRSPPTWGFSVRSDETVAIPPQKWHLIATTFKTDTRKGQFADLPGRSHAFAWPCRPLLGADVRRRCLALPTFAGADVRRPSLGLANLCGGRRLLLASPDFACFRRTSLAFRRTSPAFRRTSPAFRRRSPIGDARPWTPGRPRAEPYRPPSRRNPNPGAGRSVRTSRRNLYSSAGRPPVRWSHSPVGSTRLAEATSRRKFCLWST